MTASNRPTTTDHPPVGSLVHDLFASPDPATPVPIINGVPVLALKLADAAAAIGLSPNIMTKLINERGLPVIEIARNAKLVEIGALITWLRENSTVLAEAQRSEEGGP